MFSWLKYLNSFISRSVRRQNMEWSKGVIFLIATFCWDGLCSAELCNRMSFEVTEYWWCEEPTIQHRTLLLPPRPGYHIARTHWMKSCASLMDLGRGSPLCRESLLSSGCKVGVCKDYCGTTLLVDLQACDRSLAVQRFTWLVQKVACRSCSLDLLDCGK